MKKIQVSTIEMQCNAEVVVLNSYTVARAAKAALGVEEFKDISEALGQSLDLENGAVDDSGEPVTHLYIHRDQLKILLNYVFPFIEEFAKAFENEEESEH